MAERLGLTWGRGAILGGAALVLLGEIASTRLSSKRHDGIAWALILLVAAINIVLTLNLRVVWTAEHHDHGGLIEISAGPRSCDNPPSLAQLQSRLRDAAAPSRELTGFT